MFNRELVDELKNIIAGKDLEISEQKARIRELESKLMAILDPEALRQFQAGELAMKRDYSKAARVPMIIGEDGTPREQTAEDRAKMIQGFQELGIF